MKPPPPATRILCRILDPYVSIRTILPLETEVIELVKLNK